METSQDIALNTEVPVDAFRHSKVDSWIPREFEMLRLLPFNNIPA